jgi:hypothetical protein
MADLIKTPQWPGRSECNDVALTRNAKDNGN